MKHIKYIFTYFLLLLLTNNSFSQFVNYPKIYFGIGTGIQSYIGGDFGKAYSLRFFSKYDYYDDYYYNNRRYYDNDRDLISPVGFDLNAGVNINEYLSVELESSFIWHFFGWPDRQYETGTSGNWDYIDKYDDSFLFANPYTINLKVYPGGRRAGLFFSGGFGWMYIKESMNRVREFYDYSYNYYNYSYTYLIKSYKDSKWCTGFKVAAGFSFPAFDYLSGELEIKYTSFYPEKNMESPLLINRVPNIGNIALVSKFYFSF